MKIGGGSIAPHYVLLPPSALVSPPSDVEVVLDLGPFDINVLLVPLGASNFESPPLPLCLLMTAVCSSSMISVHWNSNSSCFF